MKAWLHDDSEGELRSPGLMNLSTLLHFGAEISMIPAIAAPCIKGIIGRTSLEEIAGYFGGAVALNLVCQPLAFYTKANAMTSEENYELAKYLVHKYKEDKQKGLNISAALERKLVNLHLYFARKWEAKNDI